MFKLRKKRGDPLEQLSSMVIGIVVVGIVIAIGLLIMAQTRTQISTTEGVYNENGSNIASGIMTSAAWNATHTTQMATASIPGWLPIIVIVVIGTILIGLVMFFRQRT